MNDQLLASSRPPKGKFREYAESILIALLLATVIRSFVIEAYKIPSSSMVPTLLVGDHIFVNKFVYGLRLPFTKFWMTHWGPVARGDVIIFLYPQDESKNYIKRVVGLPGDTIAINGHTVTVNGVPLPHTEVPAPTGADDAAWANYYHEQQDGKTYLVRYERALRDAPQVFAVGPDEFFVMGDNRHNSQDSRFWGGVPKANVKGRAMFIWLSRDHEQGGVRWARFGDWVE